MGKKIEIGLVEYSNRMLVHEKIEIDVEQYPELDGLSDEEILSYIKENSYKMKPSESDSWADSLHDELMEMDVIRDKEYSYETDIYND